MPVQQSILFATAEDLERLLSAVGVSSRSIDEDPGVLSVESLRNCLEWGTAQIKLYLQTLYDDEQLAQSWVVNEWATVLAAVRLCSRRLNGVPDALRLLAYGENGQGGVYADLKAVRDRKLHLPDIAYRNVDWPAWSNVRVDPNFRLRQIRVQRPLSENTPTQYPQQPDVMAEWSWEI